MIVPDSGGGLYHLRAFRALITLRWRKPQRKIKKALEGWRETLLNHGLSGEFKTIVLVGPSGGYLLPFEFLFKFEKIVCFDPDPVAEKFFRLRVWVWKFFVRFNVWKKKSKQSLDLRNGSVSQSVIWIKRDFFEDIQSNDFFNELQIFEENACFLFCNILGQYALFADQNDFLKLKKFLVGKKWFSFHETKSFTHGIETTHSIPEQFFEDSIRIDSFTWEIEPEMSHFIDCVQSRA